MSKIRLNPSSGKCPGRTKKDKITFELRNMLYIVTEHPVEYEYKIKNKKKPFGVCTPFPTHTHTHTWRTIVRLTNSNTKASGRHGKKYKQIITWVRI
jgi:hypothetical protein